MGLDSLRIEQALDRGDRFGFVVPQVVLSADQLGVAEEEALVELLPPGEAGADHIPGQAEERNLAVAVLTCAAEIALNGGAQRLKSRGRGEPP